MLKQTKKKALEETIKSAGIQKEYWKGILTNGSYNELSMTKEEVKQHLTYFTGRYKALIEAKKIIYNS